MSAFLLAKINGINELAEWFRVAFTSKKVVNMLAALVVLSGAPVITDRLAQLVLLCSIQHQDAAHKLRLIQGSRKAGRNRCSALADRNL